MFDLVEQPVPFLERKQKMQKIVQRIRQPWIQAVEHINFTERNEFERYYQSVMQSGGEGVMLIKGNAFYIDGRALSLKKYKPYFDSEATIIDYHYNPKNGMLASLLVKDRQGREFKVGSGLTQQQRQHPPAIGQVITFAHSGYYASGIPRYPRFLRMFTEL